MGELERICVSCGLKKLSLTLDPEKKSLINLFSVFCNLFLAQLDDKRYCALITHQMNMQVDDNVRRDGKRQPDFTYDGPHLFIGPAEKMEEVKIISNAASTGHWIIEAGGICISYFRKTDGIPNQPYDQYSFSEKDGIFHVIPQENIFRGMPIFVILH